MDKTHKDYEKYEAAYLDEQDRLYEYITQMSARCSDKVEAYGRMVAFCATALFGPDHTKAEELMKNWTICHELMYEHTAKLCNSFAAAAEQEDQRKVWLVGWRNGQKS